MSKIKDWSIDHPMDSEINILEEDKVYTGYLGTERTWRVKTGEERLREAGINPEVANLYIALNEQ